MPDRPIRVGIVEKNQNPYWDSVNAGWHEAAGRLGLTLDIRAPEHENVDQQRSLLEDLIDEGVDAIAFVGTVDDAFDDVCRRARAQDVVVTTFDLDASRDHRQYFIGMTDPRTIGRRVGARVVGEVEPGSTVVLMAGSAHARGAVGKLDGLTSVLVEAGIRVAVSPPDGEDATIAARHADALFAENADAAAAIGVYGYHPAVLAAAAGRAGSTARIHGFDMLPETVELLATGAVASSVWIREYYFGYLAAAAVHDLVRLGPEIVEVLAGVSDGAGRSLELEPRVFTAADVHEYVQWRDAHLRTLAPSR